MIALTDNALEAVRRVLAEAQESPDDSPGLRISVETGGCSGYRYRLVLEDQAEEGDEVIALEGITLFVDPTSAPLLQGAEMDFVEETAGSGFVFTNPNAKAQCGCGKSFC